MYKVSIFSFGIPKQQKDLDIVFIKPKRVNLKKKKKYYKNLYYTFLDKKNCGWLFI